MVHEINVAHGTPKRLQIKYVPYDMVHRFSMGAQLIKG